MINKNITIQDIRQTFKCDRKRAIHIRDMIKKLSLEAREEEVRREERKGIQGEVPF